VVLVRRIQAREVAKSLVVPTFEVPAVEATAEGTVWIPEVLEETVRPGAAFAARSANGKVPCVAAILAFVERPAKRQHELAEVFIFLLRAVEDAIPRIVPDTLRGTGEIGLIDAPEMVEEFGRYRVQNGQCFERDELVHGSSVPAAVRQADT
jgi:hypothetical protein